MTLDFTLHVHMLHMYMSTAIFSLPPSPLLSQIVLHNTLFLGFLHVGIMSIFYYPIQFLWVTPNSTSSHPICTSNNFFKIMLTLHWHVCTDSCRQWQLMWFEIPATNTFMTSVLLWLLLALVRDCQTTIAFAPACTGLESNWIILEWSASLEILYLFWNCEI